jgi:DNA-3-methyladenine glycosylase II
MDVLSIGDLGVQRGFNEYLSKRPWLQQELDGVDWSVPISNSHSPGKSKKALDRKPSTKKAAKGIPEHKKMEYVAQRFAPYRSAFQMILWQLSAIELAALEGKSKAKSASKVNSKASKLE